MTAPDDEAAFLSAILKDPADDTVRLVFADWLEENGNAPWARFIRHQIWTPVSPCHNAPLTALLSLEPFVGPLPHVFDRNVSGIGGATVTYPNGWEFWFRRGFIAEVWLPLAAYLEHAESLFKSHPVERVVLTGAEPAVYTGNARRVYFWVDGEPDLLQPYCIPPDVWLRLDRWDTVPANRDSSGRDGWETESEARDALSAACVAHGRALAGVA